MSQEAGLFTVSRSYPTLTTLQKVRLDHVVSKRGSLYLAARAFKSAIFTLHNLSGHPQTYAYDPSSRPSTSPSTYISSFIPSAQGQGPVGSAIRIAQKLYHRIFLSGNPSRIKKKDEEMQRKAIKVIDLLQHSAELGNSDALYTLAHVSLVRTRPREVSQRLTSLPVSSKHLFSLGPQISVLVVHHARFVNWERHFTSVSGFLLCHRLCGCRSHRSDKGSPLLYICCTRR